MEAVRQRGPSLSHEERDACLHALGALHASGKLSLSELDVRIQAALAARTDAELAALVRESSRIEVAPPRPTQEEPPAAVAPRHRRAEGWLFAARLVGFVALALLGAFVRVVALAAVALGVGVVRALTLAAWGSWVVCQSLARRGKALSKALGRAETGPVPARLQLRRAPSRELVVVPSARVPAQRVPHKVHPVIVPTDADPSSTTSVPAGQSTEVVPVRAAIRGALLARDLTSVGTTVSREDRRVRVLVSQLRPLVHRVADRARWRRMTTNACERAAHTKSWRRSLSVSRTGF